jgi:hypothetical protein
VFSPCWARNSLLGPIPCWARPQAHSWLALPAWLIRWRPSCLAPWSLPATGGRVAATSTRPRSPGVTAGTTARARGHRSGRSGSRQTCRLAYAEPADVSRRGAAASRGEMRAATTLLALLMSAMPAAGTASTGGSTAGTASTTAAPGATTRQEAPVLGEVLGRLRSLEGETARLAEAQRVAEAQHTAALSAAEMRHTAAVAALERRMSDLEAEREWERDTAGEEGSKTQQSSGKHPPRRLQAPPARGNVVHIHHTNVTFVPAGPGWNVSLNYNGGHRRSLQQQSSAQCGNMAARTQLVQARCCDEPMEDCSSGYPRTCNAGCAAVFLPFWAECGSLLGNAVVYQQTVSLCRQAQPTTPASAGGGLAHEFNLVCADDAVGDCVPACSAALRGDLLLMNLNGEDSKYSCELHHGLHSWVGAATDGGYLGSDVRAFVSAVLSGAAGYYAVSLASVAAVGTDLVIRPGQDVHIAMGASVTSWGSGSFTVQQGGSLSLVGVSVQGSVTVQGRAGVSDGSMGGNVIVAANGILDLNRVVWKGQSLALTATQNLQCYQPYTTLTDGWRSTSTGRSNHCDSSNGSGDSSNPTGVGGGHWYRFAGPGGDALPLSNPGTNHCGTHGTGWLSGWTGAGFPPTSYSAAGRYPVALEGAVEMVVCFDDGNPCGLHGVVGVVRCGGFLLWRLQDAADCGPSAYCTAPSGL